MSGRQDDFSPPTMDQLYEEAFGPPMDARKNAMTVLRHQLKDIPGFEYHDMDKDYYGACYFSLKWKFRGKEMERRFPIYLQLKTEYVVSRLEENENEKKLLEKDRGILVFANFFSSSGGWLNVRRWSPCRRCGAVDFTIDVARDGLRLPSTEDYIAYFPILEQKHECPKEEQK